MNFVVQLQKVYTVNKRDTFDRVQEENIAVR